MLMNSSHKKTALKPAEKGTVPIRVEGTEVSKAVFLRKKKKKNLMFLTIERESIIVQSSGEKTTQMN